MPPIPLDVSLLSVPAGAVVLGVPSWRSRNMRTECTHVRRSVGDVGPWQWAAAPQDRAPPTHRLWCRLGEAGQVENEFLLSLALVPLGDLKIENPSFDIV